MSQTATILIVDDMPENVSVLFDFLSRHHFGVLIAEDGKRALQVVEFTLPDLILLDVMMPGVDGFETCRHLKANPRTQGVPIIFITALSDTVNKIKGFELGAADYVTKPFQIEEVLARINTHLKLNKLQRALLEQNQQLQKLTTDLHEHTLELEKRNAELDAFAHTVAHDLKNPLNAVVNLTGAFLEVYADNDAVETKWKERLQLVEKSGQLAANIVNALLMLAGVSRQGTVRLELLNMQYLVSKVMRHLSLLIEDYQGIIELPDRWVEASGYPPWIEEVWINYLTNGLKYGGRPPHLILGSDFKDEKNARFWVRDNGPGLLPEEQSQLFTPFTRLHKARGEGHGLGLSIVRQIVEKLGGSVGVESTPQEGSLFFFILPIERQRKSCS